MAGRRVSRFREMVGSRPGTLLVVAVLCGLLLSGCGDIGETLADLFHINGNGDAEAQDGDDGEKIIQTFTIDSGTFELRADMMPDIMVVDGTTRYTLRSSATLDADPDPRIPQLEAGDIVIERPGSNSVTVIRDR